MTQYLYPQNLKATANLWLWGCGIFVFSALPRCYPLWRWCSSGL